MWPVVERPSLARRIVASVAFGLALILVLFGFVAFWTIQESTEAAYRERVVLAQVLAQHVDETLRYTLATLEHEATEIRIEPGRPLTEAERHGLADLRLQVGTFAILSVADAEGSAIWTEPSWASVAIGRPRDHPSAQLALHTGKPQISQFRSATDPRAIFACLAVPLSDQSGRRVGVLMAELDPARTALNLLPAEGPDNSLDAPGMHIQLVDAAGQLLAGTPERDPAMATEHEALLGDLIAARAAGYRIHDPPSARGSPSHLVAYAPLSLLPWGVIAEQPSDVVLAMPHRLQQRLALAGILALLLAAGVAWFDTRRVVRPLKHLTAAAERFAAGQLEQPVHLDRTDELGILANAFETMRQRLRTSLEEIAAWNRELERRVAGRTAELEALSGERAGLLQHCITGQEDERRRLAQELHDETSQALVSLQLGLERLAAGVEEPEHARHVAAQLQGVASQTLMAVHRLAVELRPSVLDDVGLVAALERYLQDNARHWELAVDFAAVGVDHLRLIPAAETAVYRIVQAALTNIARHAKAQHVSVLLERRRDARLMVAIEDDGQGFDLAAVRAAPLETRLGLAGMEERASLIGATLTVETAPGAGATVFLEIPLGLNARREEAGVEAAHRAG